MSFDDAFLNIDTPENVVFGYEVVGIGSRFMAALVDTSIILVLQIVVNVTMFLLAGSLFDVSGEAWVTAVFGLISFVLLWGYYIFFEILWNGQSPGKRWVGLRVLKIDGTPITLAESIVRNLVRLVDFLPLFYGVGVVAMFINDQSRRLGDLAAGTLVVRDQEQLTLESVTAAAPQVQAPLRAPSQIEAAVDSWPIELLSDADIELTERYLQRRIELENGPQLAQQIAQRLLERMHMADTTVNTTDIPYILARIVKLYRAMSV